MKIYKSKFFANFPQFPDKSCSFLVGLGENPLSFAREIAKEKAAGEKTVSLTQKKDCFEY